MENFKRINKNSKISVGPIEQLLYLENATTMILQITGTGVKSCIDDPLGEYEIFICEYIERSEAQMPDHIGMPTADIDFENYLDTIINSDPFGGKYSNKPIKAVFEAGDREWLDTALKNMKNKFIRERLQYVVDRGGYGKIKC